MGCETRGCHILTKLERNPAETLYTLASYNIIDVIPMEIFKNKEVLDIEYIPTEEMLLYRGKEQEHL